jgi:hypothetical protein
MKKATQLNGIDAAVDRFTPVTPDHEFYVDFDNLRGTFQERKVMNILNVSTVDGQYRFEYEPNRYNKTLLFLAGMRGSGKTSELAKYAQKLHSPDCFFVVTCNIDTELDMDNVQYMDILVFQLEKLLDAANAVTLTISDSILDSMNVWFEQRVDEINKSLKAEGNAELEVGNDDAIPFSVSGLLGKLLGVTGKLKAGLSGSNERAMAIRTTLKNRFSDFAVKFNTFIEQVNEQLRREDKGRELLFIVDGLEKTFSAEVRRKIIMEESNRIKSIKANTIFTLPIELMQEDAYIQHFGEIITFPFVKIMERDGSPVQTAITRFEELVCKRIDRRLFDSVETIHFAIRYSGGSPRQLLRLIQQASWEVFAPQQQITIDAMQRAIQQEATAKARYLQPNDYVKLRELRADLDSGSQIGFDNAIQQLLEKEIIFEYNDGTYKRVNPLVEVSRLYQQKVIDAA